MIKNANQYLFFSDLGENIQYVCGLKSALAYKINFFLDYVLLPHPLAVGSFICKMCSFDPYVFNSNAWSNGASTLIHVWHHRVGPTWTRLGISVATVTASKHRRRSGGTIPQ